MISSFNNILFFLFNSLDLKNHFFLKKKLEIESSFLKKKGRTVRLCTIECSIVEEIAAYDTLLSVMIYMCRGVVRDNDTKIFHEDNKDVFSAILSNVFFGTPDIEMNERVLKKIDNNIKVISDHIHSLKHLLNNIDN